MHLLAGQGMSSTDEPGGGGLSRNSGKTSLLPLLLLLLLHMLGTRCVPVCVGHHMLSTHTLPCCCCGRCCGCCCMTTSLRQTRLERAGAATFVTLLELRKRNE
jgi:hypothetical protein